MTSPLRLRERLADAGFVAADIEAEELLAAAGGDGARLEAMVARRLTGEPLAWITGTTTFCGLTVRVAPGVYVPREQSELVARRAIERLPADGAAVDLCTGSGAIAMALAAARPDARVLAFDLDERAVACARSNGVDAHQGDLLGALDTPVDVIVAVVPYVPTPDLELLQRDTLTFESPLAYDGGPEGATLLRRLVREAPRHLRPGGALVLELGAGQPETLVPDLGEYREVTVLQDEDGDVRGLEALLGPS